MKVTAVTTAERIQEYGDISRYGVEEFVTDNVVILRNVLYQEKRIGDLFVEGETM